MSGGDKELTPTERSAAIKHICRQMDVPPTEEVQEYIRGYVDLRALDPEAASEKYPATEQAIKRTKRRTNLGGWGVQHGN